MIRPVLAAMSVAAGFGIAAIADVGDPVVPDPQLTPGEVVPVDWQASYSSGGGGGVALTARDSACAWGHSPRLYDLDKDAYVGQELYVFRAYNIPISRRGEFELDHLVPRCIGGADTVRNLWPQHCDGWSAKHLHCILGAAADKDMDERRICRAVCHARTMTIEDGQRFFTEGRWQ